MNIFRKLLLVIVEIPFFLYETIVRKLFGPKTYAAEDVEGKVVVITGANSGIGKAAALDFAKRRAIVVLACRNMEEGRKAQEEAIQGAAGAPAVDLVQLDLADMDSVRKCVDIIGKKYPAIHILVANAGYSFTSPTLKKTKDGFEQHIAVNHLGHFLLTNLLLPNLKKAAPSRIVFTASTMQRFAEFDPNDLMMEKTNLQANKILDAFFDLGSIPYSNSKLCNSMFTKTLADKLKGTGVTTYSVCPGLVQTSIFRYLTPTMNRRNDLLLKVLGLTPEQGAEVIMYCALAKELKTESGKFYRFCKPTPSFNRFLRKNQDKALQLWDISERLVKLKSN